MHGAVLNTVADEQRLRRFAVNPNMLPRKIKGIVECTQISP